MKRPIEFNRIADAAGRQRAFTRRARALALSARPSLWARIAALF